MRRQLHTPATDPRSGSSAPAQGSLTLGTRWQGPTLDEFVRRVEQEFGASPELADLLVAEIGADENLQPDDVRVLCSQIGVPAEDFGV